jgi:hypothetical protein
VCRGDPVSEKINGGKNRFEHSACGAIEICELAKDDFVKDKVICHVPHERVS